MPPRRRIALSSLLALCLLLVSIEYRLLYQAPHDLYLPFCSSIKLLNGQNPYSCSVIYNGYPAASYPLTTFLLVLPFAAQSQIYLWEIIFWALTCWLFAFALLRDGQTWRLLVFISAPFALAFYTLQLSPLLLAVVLLPSLYPIALVKPQIGIPILLTRSTRVRLIVSLVFLAVTFLIIPDWPLRWLAQLGHYDGFIPLLVLPFGLLLLLPLARWHDRDARYFFILCCMPQRGLYDALMLLALPASKRQMLLLVGLGWLGFMAWRATGLDQYLAILLTCYFPSLGLILYPTITAKLRAVLAGAPVPKPY